MRQPKAHRPRAVELLDARHAEELRAIAHRDGREIRIEVGTEQVHVGTDRPRRRLVCELRWSPADEVSTTNASWMSKKVEPLLWPDRKRQGRGLQAANRHK